MTSATHIYTVYKITNLINNNYYIGIHMEKPNEALRDYMGSGVDIRAAIEDDGIENFHKEILYRYDNALEMIAKEEELVTQEMVESRECYNLQTGGGYAKWSEASKQKMRGERNPMYGKPGTFKGKKHTDETLEKMREKARGRKHTYETLEKMRGRKLSKASREKISEKMSGENNHQAKQANIYDYKTDRLIAERVVIAEWCRANGYRPGNLSKTTRADRTLPSSRTNPHHHKGIYAQYVG